MSLSYGASLVIVFPFLLQLFVRIYFISFLLVWRFCCAGTTVEREIRSGIETTTTHATITLPPNVEVSKTAEPYYKLLVSAVTSILTLYRYALVFCQRLLTRNWFLATNGHIGFYYRDFYTLTPPVIPCYTPFFTSLQYLFKKID